MMNCDIQTTSFDVEALRSRLRQMNDVELLDHSCSLLATILGAALSLLTASWGLTTENSKKSGATTWSERLSSVREVDNRQNQIAHTKPGGVQFPLLTED